MLTRAQPPEIPRGFVPGALLCAAAADAIRPREKLDVHECARRHRYLHNPGGGYSGLWSDEQAPYLVRPMKCLTDMTVSLVALMGPVQCGKSEVGNNWIAHSVIADPANMLWLGPDKSLLRDYVVQKVNPMIRHSPAISDHQLRTPSADNQFSKEFVGMVVNFIWPSAAQFRMRSMPRWIADDFDAVPDDIEGEGDPLTLLAGRQTTFEGRERGLAMSSPSRAPSKGIEALVAGGTDERYVLDCPHCGEPFAPDTLRDLRFDGKGTPETAEASAHVVCPNNGCIIMPAEKSAMTQAALARPGHGWVGAGQKALAGFRVEGARRASSVASFRIDGLIAFPTWGKIAKEWRTAEIVYQRTQDESKLRAFVNTRAGQNYRSRLEDAAPPDADQLRARAENLVRGLVPEWARFLTAAVDVQSNRFEIMVAAWGADCRSAVVDRFSIHVFADGRTPVRPAREAAHWDVLAPHVLARLYPLAADPARALPIAATAIDSGGLPGVAEHAKEFLRRTLAAGAPDWAVALVKGAATRTADPLGRPAFEVDDRGKRRADGVALHVIGVHALKDTIETRLRLAAPGPGYIHLPKWLEPEHFDELRGEEKEDGEWVKVGRNETWDLAVYCEWARLHLREHRVADWSTPPVWAAPVRAPAASPILAAPAPSVAPPPARPSGSIFRRPTRFRRVRSRGVG